MGIPEGFCLSWIMSAFLRDRRRIHSPSVFEKLPRKSKFTEDGENLMGEVPLTHQIAYMLKVSPFDVIPA